MTNEELVAKIKRDSNVKEYMQLLYENNLPLIRKVCQPYAHIEPMEDLLNQSYFGLLKAVERYESMQEVKFMSFAVWWIRQEIMRYVETCGSAVRMPSYEVQKIQRYLKCVKKLEQELFRTPDDFEVAVSMNVPVEDVESLKKYAQPIASLDAPVGEDGEMCLCDTIQAPNNYENEIIDKIHNEYTKNEIWGVLKQYVDEQENQIIRDYFLSRKSMPEIAKEYGISVAKVRRIQENGLRKMKMNRIKRELKQKFDIVDSSLYHTGIKTFKLHHESSVENAVLRRYEIQSRYDRLQVKMFR